MPRHPNYRGGSITEPRGYKLVYVGKAHHLADCRGYTYEHRLIAEQKLGRKLRKGEVVHHKKAVGNNSKQLLKVYPSNAAHLQDTKGLDKTRRRWNEPNSVIACACGCGKTFERFDSSGRVRRFLSGHNQSHEKGYLEYQGERRTRAEWAERTGIGKATIRKRLNEGWTVQRTLTIPTRNGRRQNA